MKCDCHGQGESQCFSIACHSTSPGRSQGLSRRPHLTLIKLLHLDPALTPILCGTSTNHSWCRLLFMSSLRIFALTYLVSHVLRYDPRKLLTHLIVAPHPVTGFRSSFSIRITPLASPVCLPAFHRICRLKITSTHLDFLEKILLLPSLHLQPSKLLAIFPYCLILCSCWKNSPLIFFSSVAVSQNTFPCLHQFASLLDSSHQVLVFLLTVLLSISP